MSKNKDVKPCMNIEWAQDHEIFAELSSRFHDWVFCAMRPLKNDDTQDERILRWRGSDVTAVGLLHLSVSRITNKIIGGDVRDDAG